MANSAADAGGSELEIRKKLIADKAVDVIVAVGSELLLHGDAAGTLWFFDRGKRGTEREDKVLFIDARKIFHQIDRAHRDWLPEQIEFLANIARLYRGEEVETAGGPRTCIAESFPDGAYIDVPGLCAVATLERSRSRAGASIPGGTSAWRQPRTTASTFACDLRNSTRSWRSSTRGGRTAGADRRQRGGAAGVTRGLERALGDVGRWSHRKFTTAARGTRVRRASSIYHRASRVIDLRSTVRSRRSSARHSAVMAEVVWTTDRA